MRFLFPAGADANKLKGTDLFFYLLTLSFFISLFIPKVPVVPNILCGAMLVLSFASNSISEKLLLLRSRPVIVLLLLYYLLHVLSIIWSADKAEAVRQLSIRLPILLFPLAIGTMQLSKVLQNNIIYALVVSITAVAVISVGLSMVQYVNTGNKAYLYNDSLTAHFNLQSVYVAMLVNISIAGGIYLLSTKPVLTMPAGILYVAIPLLFTYHFLLASRSAMILLYGALFLYAVYYIVRKRKYLEGVTLLLGMLIGAFMLFKFFPKTVQRFKELAYTNFSFESNAAESHYDMQLDSTQWNGANTRLALWSCAWEVAKNNLLTGVGVGDRVAAVQEVYKARHFTMAIQTNKNAHNSYLDALLTFGVAGLLLFLFGFVVLPLQAVMKHGNLFELFVVVVFIVSMIFEVYLGRSIGCMLAGFFYSFIAAAKKEPLADH